MYVGRGSGSSPITETSCIGVLRVDELLPRRTQFLPPACATSLIDGREIVAREVRSPCVGDRQCAAADAAPAVVQARRISSGVSARPKDPQLVDLRRP